MSELDDAERELRAARESGDPTRITAAARAVLKARLADVTFDYAGATYAIRSVAPPGGHCRCWWCRLKRKVKP